MKRFLNSRVALLLLALIALLLALSLSSVATSLSPFASPQQPPATPTPSHFFYNPLVMKNYDIATPTPGPTPRPTLPPATCAPVWLDGVTYIEALGSGQWQARKVLTCGGGGHGSCFFYHDGEYLGYGVNEVVLQAACTSTITGTIGVLRRCEYDDSWLYKELDFTNYPPTPCP